MKPQIMKEKPKLELRFPEDTFVNPRTQEEYDTLMQVCECSRNLYWFGTEDATSINFWKYNEEKTGVFIEKVFTKNCHNGRKRLEYSDENDLWEEGIFRRSHKRISPNYLYFKNGITQDEVKEINKWFDTYNSNRASKGDLK